jgi:DNA modification methylase
VSKRGENCFADPSRRTSDSRRTDVETGKDPVREAQGDDYPIPIRDRIRELRRVRARDLKPNPKNWRKHPRAQAAALRGLLTEIGYADALLVRELSDGSLMIIDGHLRAETTPDSIVPVLILDVTEEEAEKLLLTLDPLAALAESDVERMTALLKTVKTDSEPVQELLRRTAGNCIWETIHPRNLDEAAISSEADELQKKWGTEAGQRWQIGQHRVTCADSTDPAMVGRLWEDDAQSFRMIWSDPPYGVDYSRKNRFLNAFDRGNRIQKPIANDEDPRLAPGVFAAGMRMALAYAVKGAAAYVSVPGGPLLQNFIAAFNDSGFSFKASLVWTKQQFVIGRSDYQWAHENILYGWIENGAHYFIDDRTQRSVFEIDKPHVSTLHATQKPIELISRMIANSSRPGEVVYDPFAGSGSTLVAAHQLGRIGYGCEIDPSYVAVILERLSLLGLEPELVR